MKILSIETLHAKARVDKKDFQKVQRFARVLVNGNGKKKYQINSDGEAWVEVDEGEFHGRVETTRDALILKLKEVNAKVKEK